MRWCAPWICTCSTRIFSALLCACTFTAGVLSQIPERIPGPKRRALLWCTRACTFKNTGIGAETILECVCLPLPPHFISRRLILNSTPLSFKYIIFWHTLLVVLTPYSFSDYGIFNKAFHLEIHQITTNFQWMGTMCESSTDIGLMGLRTVKAEKLKGILFLKKIEWKCYIYQFHWCFSGLYNSMKSYNINVTI